MPHGFYLAPRLQDVTTFRDCIKFQSLLRSDLLVLAANWSITAHAKVAGMDFSRLEVDTDFRRAVRDIVAEIDQSYWRRNSAFRSVVADVVEGCQLSYRAAGTYAAMRKLFEDFHGEPLPAALRQQLGALVLCFVTVSFVLAEPCVR